MEALSRYDLPTLHRPAEVEETLLYKNFTRKVKPIPTPPNQHSENMRHRLPYSSNGRREYGTLPTMLSDYNWRVRRAKRQPVEDLPGSSDFDVSYEELSSRKAYRHPHPGAPKGRQGGIGGTWRHTKETVGYGPGRLMWIDGIVSLYDDWELNYEKPWSACRERLPTNYREPQRPERGTTVGVQSLHQRQRLLPHKQPSVGDKSKTWYTSNQPQPLPFAQSQREVKGVEGGKYKGFYSMSQTYS